ncbi:MAG: ARMT1-like domain-containing protein [bacterium]|nr:ARMT1-like domain-containing protein [bacterium]
MPCVYQQALSAVRHATKDRRVQERVMRAVAKRYQKKSLRGTPADYSQEVYWIVAQVTGVADPYAREKRECNRMALAMVPDCYAALRCSPDKVVTGAHLAVAGNVIDLGIKHGLDIHRTLRSAVETPFAINDLPRLRQLLKRARRVLYLGDNAGEIVFDRVFIEVLRECYPRVEVKFVVKSGPIINDATMADAEQVGMTSVCEVIESGCAEIGLPLRHVSRACRRAFAEADVVIAKGHGNYETLAGERSRPIVFILKAKCGVVARSLGVAIGSSVLAWNRV